MAPYLDESETTVGVHICMSHVAAAADGEIVTIAGRWPRWASAACTSTYEPSAAIAWWVRARTSGPSSTPAASPADHAV